MIAGRAAALAFVAAFGGGCAMQASGEEKAVGDEDASAAFTSGGATYRMSVQAPTACFEAAPEVERSDLADGSVRVTRLLRRFDGFCAQVITEVIFEGVVEDVAGDLLVSIVDQAGQEVRARRFERPK